MKKNLLLIFLCSTSMALSAQVADSLNSFKLLVGTYTNAKSEGVYVYNFNSKTGHSDKVSSVFTPDPSYLAVSNAHKFVYAVNERGGERGAGMVTSFTYKNGQLTKLNEQTTKGDDPCYLSFDGSGKWLVAGNYTGGNFALFPVMEDGSVGVATSVTNHSGKSVNVERQEKAHVHCTIFSPDNKYLLVADLGTDEVFVYSFNEKTGALGKPVITKVSPGAGPRHLVFHPNGKYLYLVEELIGSVQAYKYKNGKLKPQQTISIVQHKSSGKIGAADIHISADGRFLYTSNRGDANELSVFSVNNDGNLKIVGHQSVLGLTPRNFTIDPTGNFLLVANQNSDEVIVFKRNKKTGELTDSKERIKIPNPVCLKWF